MNPYEMEELEAEYNARFDYIREAYAGSQLDHEYEAFCDSGCPSWDEWVASQNEAQAARLLAPAPYEGEIPF